MRIFATAFGIISLALYAALPVEAATIKTFNRAGFATEMLNYAETTRTLEFLALGPVSTAPGVTYSATGGNVVVTKNFMSSTGLNSLGSGAKAFFLSSQRVTFTFQKAIVAFAIDINTFAKKSGAFLASLNTGEVVASVFDPFGAINPYNGPAPLATGQFIGLTSTNPFTTVTISGLSGLVQPTFNLDTIVTVDYVKPPEPPPEPSVVPLPAALPLMLAGLGALSVFRRRR